MSAFGSYKVSEIVIKEDKRPGFTLDFCGHCKLWFSLSGVPLVSVFFNAFLKLKKVLKSVIMESYSG